MTEPTRTRLLKIFLRVWGVGSIAIFGFIFVGYAMHISAFRLGGRLHWMVWDDLPGHVAMMLAAIYLTWAVFILLAAAIYLLRPRATVTPADVPRSPAVA